MNRPILATYRIQFTPEFRFEHAEPRVSYLQNLGISHLYSSPILRSRPGSTHGYDVVDPAQVDPELGGESRFRALAAQLHRRDMGLLLDIVPNHMAASAENPYWEDVLTYGRDSRFAPWFDIDFRLPDPELWGRVVIPVLGDSLDRVIELDQLKVVVEKDSFRVRYFDQSFPLHPATLPSVLRFVIQNTGSSIRPDDPVLDELRELRLIFRALPRPSGRTRKAQAFPHDEARAALSRLAAALNSTPAVRASIETAARKFGAGTQGHLRLRRLLDAQCYRLAYWRRGARILNYRRFFDINDLVAIRQEAPEVFAETHDAVIRWTQEGLIDALRVDHVDGLRDPQGYLCRLVDAVNDPKQPADQHPVFVEKILAHHEPLPESWPVAGTTGYEFLNQVEALFLSPEGFAEIERNYRQLLRRPVRFRNVMYWAKRRVLRNELSSFVGQLARVLFRLASYNPANAPFTHTELLEAIVETVVCLPVYRTYIAGRDGEMQPTDRQFIENALAGARWRQRAAPAELDFLDEVLLLKNFADLPENEKQERIRFIQRFQQLSGPAAAKGVEDTALYVYVPLVSRNEVGGEPDTPLDSAPADLHRANSKRASTWPRTMLAATTHDTKRTADVRSRLDVLSEYPKIWAAHVARWRQWSRPHRRRVDGIWAPDRNTEYLFYQTVVGLWPVSSPLTPDVLPSPECLAELRDRVQAYMLKAVREMKLRTTWIDPDEGFESAVASFVDAVLSPGETPSDFQRDLNHFVARIARPGFWNALARTLIQFTSPGTPDLYQGDEIWNFALVDPDNRRPVDFDLREKLLEQVSSARRGPADQLARFAAELVDAPEDGRCKLHVIHTALQTRAAFPLLFTNGAYEPLEPQGAAARHVFAFARTAGSDAAVTVVPRLSATLVNDPARAPVGEVWGDTVLHLPEPLRGRIWSLPLTGQKLGPADVLPLSDVLQIFPVALLVAEEKGGA